MNNNDDDDVVNLQEEGAPPALANRPNPQFLVEHRLNEDMEEIVNDYLLDYENLTHEDYMELGKTMAFEEHRAEGWSDLENRHLWTGYVRYGTRKDCWQMISREFVRTRSAQERESHAEKYYGIKVPPTKRRRGRPFGSFVPLVDPPSAPPSDDEGVRQELLALPAPPIRPAVNPPPPSNDDNDDEDGGYMVMDERGVVMAFSAPSVYCPPSSLPSNDNRSDAEGGYMIDDHEVLLALSGQPRRDVNPPSPPPSDEESSDAEGGYIMDDREVVLAQPAQPRRDVKPFTPLPPSGDNNNVAAGDYIMDDGEVVLAEPAQPRRAMNPFMCPLPFFDYNHLAGGGYMMDNREAVLAPPSQHRIDMPEAASSVQIAPPAFRAASLVNVVDEPGPDDILKADTLRLFPVAAPYFPLTPEKGGWGRESRSFSLSEVGSGSSTYYVAPPPAEWKLWQPDPNAHRSLTDEEIDLNLRLGK